MKFKPAIFKNKTLLVTGDSGFKGSWLSLWLQQLGARVIGCSLPPPTEPSHFRLLKLDEKITHYDCDIRDDQSVNKVFEQTQPDFVFHLAAQPLVISSYQDPKETFDTNVLGTVNVLEAIRKSSQIEGAVVVTSDKCYENRNWQWGYRENDPLGGKDPYSTSKAAAEMVVESYRSSFFSRPGSPAIATARAGNVIGGGDFAEWRIFPDLVRSIEENKPLEVRSPGSVRPWLHVLEPLYGYLLLAQQLLIEGAPYAEAWNFGPKEPKGVMVKELISYAIQMWGKGEMVTPDQVDAPQEAQMLRLNWDKAAHELNWHPKYSWKEAVKLNVDWYQAYLEGRDISAVSADQIQNYLTQTTVEV